MKMQKVTVGVSRSEQHVPGVLIPYDAAIVSVDLDAGGEHGTVTYYRIETVDVDDEPSEA